MPMTRIEPYRPPHLTIRELMEGRPAAADDGGIRGGGGREEREERRVTRGRGAHLACPGTAKRHAP